MQPELVYNGSPWLLKQQRERRAQHPSFVRCGRCRARRCHWEALRARPASSPAPAPAPPPPGGPPGYAAGPGPDFLLDADPLDPLSSGEREFALSLTPESEAEVRAVGAEAQRGLQIEDRGPELGETSTSLQHQRGAGLSRDAPVAVAHPLLGPPPPQDHLHPSPVPTRCPYLLPCSHFHHLPWSHPHPGPIPTWGPLSPSPVLSPPRPHSHLGPLATLVPSLLGTQPYLNPPHKSLTSMQRPQRPHVSCAQG